MGDLAQTQHIAIDEGIVEEVGTDDVEPQPVAALRQHANQRRVVRLFARKGTQQVGRGGIDIVGVDTDQDVDAYDLVDLIAERAGELFVRPRHSVFP